MRWNVNAIITDFTKTWLDLRSDLQSEFENTSCFNEANYPSPVVADYEKIGSQYGRFFLWTTFKFYTPVMMAYSRLAKAYLESIAGPFDEPAAISTVIKAEA